MAPVRRKGRASATSQLKSMMAKTPGEVEFHSSLHMRKDFHSAWEGIFSRTGINIQDVPIRNLDPARPAIGPINTQEGRTRNTFEPTWPTKGPINTQERCPRNTFEQTKTTQITDSSSIDLAGSFFPILIKVDQSDTLIDPNMAKAWWEVPNNSFTGSIKPDSPDTRPSRYAMNASKQMNTIQINLAGSFFPVVIKADQPDTTKAWWEVPNNSFTGSNSK